MLVLPYQDYDLLCLSTPLCFGIQDNYNVKNYHKIKLKRPNKFVSGQDLKIWLLLYSLASKEQAL